MSIVKQRGSIGIDASTEGEVEGKIHELVRRDRGSFRHADSGGESATNDLSNLLHRVSASSASEIDGLIRELQLLREKLVADGNRVERDIIEYAALSQSVIEMTKIITESMLQVKKLPSAPTLTP